VSNASGLQTVRHHSLINKRRERVSPYLDRQASQKNGDALNREGKLPGSKSSAIEVTNKEHPSQMRRSIQSRYEYFEKAPRIISTSAIFYVIHVTDCCTGCVLPATQIARWQSQSNHPGNGPRESLRRIRLKTLFLFRRLLRWYFLSLAACFRQANRNGLFATLHCLSRVAAFEFSTLLLMQGSRNFLRSTGSVFSGHDMSPACIATHINDSLNCCHPDEECCDVGRGLP